MTILVALIVSFLLAAVGTVLIGVLWQTLREHARMRRTLDVAMLQVTMPKDINPNEKEEGVGEQVKERIAVAEQFLSTLANLPTGFWDTLLYGRPIIVFEIIARNDDVIVFQAGTERRYLDHMEKQIYAHYPEADVTPYVDYTIFEAGDDIRAGVATLAKGNHLPIATYKELETDPMQALTGALAKIKNRDAAVIQYILQPAGERTRRKGSKAARQTVQGKQANG